MHEDLPLLKCVPVCYYLFTALWLHRLVCCRPGVVTVHKELDKSVEKYFVSGGFAFVHPDSTADICAVRQGRRWAAASLAGRVRTGLDHIRGAGSGVPRWRGSGCSYITAWQPNCMGSTGPRQLYLG